MSWDDLELSRDDPQRQQKQAENARLLRELDELTHRVFKQNPDGAKLWDIWRDFFLFGTEGPGVPDQELRHNAGKRELVLDIRSAIKRIEEGAHDS